MPSVPENTEIYLENHTGDALLEVADPRFLQLHAACAKIAHASGAAEIIDEVLFDYETLKTLATDGSSQEVLGRALMVAGAQIIVQ